MRTRTSLGAVTVEVGMRTRTRRARTRPRAGRVRRLGRPPWASVADRLSSRRLHRRAQRRHLLLRRQAEQPGGEPAGAVQLGLDRAAQADRLHRDVHDAGIAHDARHPRIAHDPHRAPEHRVFHRVEHRHRPFVPRRHACVNAARAPCSARARPRGDRTAHGSLAGLLRVRRRHVPVRLAAGARGGASKLWHLAARAALDGPERRRLRDADAAARDHRLRVRRGARAGWPRAAGGAARSRWPALASAGLVAGLWCSEPRPRRHGLARARRPPQGAVAVRRRRCAWRW